MIRFATLVLSTTLLLCSGSASASPLSAQVLRVNPDTLSAQVTIDQGLQLDPSSLQATLNNQPVPLLDLPSPRRISDAFLGTVSVYENTLSFRIKAPADDTANWVIQGRLCDASGNCQDQRQSGSIAATLSASSIVQPQNPLTALLSSAGNSLNAGNVDLLQPSEAFNLSSGPFRDNRFWLSWDIAEGYYLYRDRLQFKLLDRDDLILAPELPEGDLKDDPTFGKVEVYHHDIQVPVLITNLEHGTDLRLEVHWQGCADIGVCYAPQKRIFEFNVTPSIDSPTPLSPSSAAPTADTGGDSVSDFGQLLEGANLLLIVSTFFGVGLLLAFTPCCLPMVPILSSIIRGNHGTAGERRLSPWVLSLTYVLAMASTYAIAGIAIGLTGQNIQAQLQHPAVIATLALLFLLLSGSMFEFYSISPPARISNWLGQISQRQRGGTLGGVAVMGALSAVIIGPCVTPPLIGSLVYISQTGDAMVGGLALFALGLGMGAPLLLLGTGLGAMLPNSGNWMHHVNALFGFTLLALAVWMADRVIDDAWTWLALRALAAAALIYFALSLLEIGQHQARRCAAALLLGVSLAVTLLWQSPQPAAHTQTQSLFNRVTSTAELQAQLSQAQNAAKPVLVDLYADWCVSCKELEYGVFDNPKFAESTQALNMQLLQLDLTDYAEDHKLWLAEKEIFGPPAVLLFRPDGKEAEDLRLIGTTDIDNMLARIQGL